MIFVTMTMVMTVWVENSTHTGGREGGREKEREGWRGRECERERDGGGREKKRGGGREREMNQAVMSSRFLKLTKHSRRHRCRL